GKWYPPESSSNVWAAPVVQRSAAAPRVVPSTPSVARTSKGVSPIGWVLSWPLWVKVLVPIVFVAILIVGRVFPGGSSTGTGDGDSACATACRGDSGHVPSLAFDAFDVCKQYVSPRLKAPGSAVWRDPIGNQVTYSNRGDVWTVIASVDSQNS